MGGSAPHKNLFVQNDFCSVQNDYEKQLSWLYRLQIDGELSITIPVPFWILWGAHPIESGCAKWFVTKYPKNKKLKNSCKIKVWSASSLNTNPYGDKSTTARFVGPFIPPHAENLKNWTHPKIQNAHSIQNIQKPMNNQWIWMFLWGGTPLKIQVCKIMSGPSKKRKLSIQKF